MDRRGPYPSILEDEKHGPAARQLIQDAQAVLKKTIAEEWFAPRAAGGFWPANTLGDDRRPWNTA